MALPDKQTLPKGRDPKSGKATDSRHNATKQKDPMRSYAQILKSDQTRDIFDLKSRNSGETFKITYTGMKPTCSRCHVTDCVFGNCPVMSQRVKHCHICNSPNHLQATYPETWWNQRKKAAKLNTTHTSPHQPKATDKEAAPVVPTSAKVDESASDKAKVTKPFITEIIPASSQEATSTNSNITESSSTAGETAPIPSGDEDGKDVAVTGEEQLTKEVEAGESEQERSKVIQEQQGDTAEDDFNDEMDGDDDVDDSDINMEEAAKEAASSSIPLDEVLQKMRRQLRLQRRKAKQLHKDNKDKALRPRYGGTASKKKASTNPSSRQ